MGYTQIHPLQDSLHQNSKKIYTITQMDKAKAAVGSFLHKDGKHDTTVHETVNPAVTQEHVHHHVHENIQPVIQKETIQPSVVHTTVPVHEVHQNEAKHHTATSLPAVTMDEFKKQGGHLSGRDERTDAFAGEPRSVGGTLGGAGAHGTTSLTEKDGHHKTQDTHGTHSTHGTGAGVGGTGLGSSTSHSSSNTTGAKPGLMDKLNPKKDADGDGKAGFMK